MVAHARKLLPMELHTNKFTHVRYGEAMFKFRENRSINNVTILSTDAGRTDGRLRDFIFCPMHMQFCIALDRQ